MRCWAMGWAKVPDYFDLLFSFRINRQSHQKNAGKASLHPHSTLLGRLVFCGWGSGYLLCLLIIFRFRFLWVRVPICPKKPALSWKFASSFPDFWHLASSHDELSISLTLFWRWFILLRVFEYPMYFLSHPLFYQYMRLLHQHISSIAWQEHLSRWCAWDRREEWWLELSFWEGYKKLGVKFIIRWNYFCKG